MNYDKKDLKLRVALPILLKNVPFVFLILKENLDQHGAEELKIVFFGVSYHTNPFKTFLICNISLCQKNPYLTKFKCMGMTSWYIVPYDILRLNSKKNQKIFGRVTRFGFFKI